MRIAYFTPVSPQKTGIADYSEREVLPYLSKYCDVDVFIDNNVRPNDKYLVDNFHIYNYKEYEELKGKYDIALYQIGNNNLHEFIYKSLIRNPGIAVLHDIYIHGLIFSMSREKGNRERYIEEFSYCHGSIGEDIAKRAMAAGAYPEFEYTLIKRIIDRSIGIICHSDFGVRKVLEYRTNPVVTKLNQPFTAPCMIKKLEDKDLEELKSKLGLENRCPIITSFGFISGHKRYAVLLNAFKKFLKEYPRSALLLVGGGYTQIDRLISDLDLKQYVVKTGYIAHGMVTDYLSISDFCVNLRYPTAGETSRSVLQIMATGKPVIVSNVGWFCELPNTTCLKVDVDSYEEDTLLECMNVLASDKRLAKAMGRNAQRYILEEHNPEKIAREQYKFISSILDGSEFVLKSISEELANLGIVECDTELILGISKKVHDIV